MRKLFLVVCSVILFASVAAAQGKVANQWKCPKPAGDHHIDVGDQPGHAFMIEQIKCTAAKGEIAGVKEKEGTGTEFHDVMGDKDSHHGIFVETMANGDKITYTYEGSGTMKNGQFQSGSNKWSATSGTGKFKGIKASGTCTAKGNPDGSAVFDCTGTYSGVK